MQLTVTGKNLHIGNALKEHIENTFKGVSEKYFHNPIEATVIVSKEAFHFRVDASVHIGKGIILRSHASHDDAHACVDSVTDKIAKRLRRHKNRIRDHHKPEAHDMAESLSVRQFVYAADEPEDQTTTGAPVVVAELTMQIPSLSLNEAIMHLDLSEQPLVVFKNKMGGQINVIFHRPDGNIGWIDPSLVK